MMLLRRQSRVPRRMLRAPCRCAPCAERSHKRMSASMCGFEFDCQGALAGRPLHSGLAMSGA
eukprot:4536595-Prymnesium_polylepis.1